MLGQEQFEKVSGIDYLHIISIFKRRYRTIILCSLLSVIAAVTYVIQATPQYRAETALLIDTRQQNVLAGAAVLAGLTTESGIIESQVEIIRSRSLLNRVAEKIDLYSDEEFLPHEGGAISNLISQFLPSSEDEEETIDPIQAEAIKKSIVLNQMDDRLMVLRKGTTQVLIIGFRSRDPEKARVIVDAVATAYLNDQLEAKLDATKRASAWLEERISGLRDELRVREQAIAAFKQKYSLYSADGATPIEQQVARLNEQLIIAKSNTAEKRAAYNQVRRLSGRGALESFSGVLSSNVIASLRDRKSEIARELADLSERYGDQHPKLRKVKSQMQDINRQISSEVKRILANAKSEFEIAKSRENSLASSLKSLRSQLNITGKYSTQLAQLEREAEIARTAFEAISERFKQTDKSEDVQQSDARIISKAETPIFPVSPKKKIIVLLALIGGSIIGCIIAFIREYLIRGFMTSDMVEEVLGISVISNIQEVDEKIMQKEAGTILLHEYIRHKPLSSFAESIRKIRVQAEGVHATTGEGQSVLVTSSVPNEGKTEIATSYAASAANAGNNVVVVDCDFRNPSVAKLFGVDVAQGLGEYLMGSVDLRDLIHKNVRENIDFIGINQIPKSPSDTLKTGKLQKLLDELKQRYQFVIMDTPPLAPVVDTAVIANCVDHIVYVTAWETTPRDVVKSTIKTLDKSKEKIAGIVLNRIDPKRESKYGYYYGYALKNYAKYYDA